MRKYCNEVKHMKSIRSKIAAAALAAVTAACSAQAITASAYTYTTRTQRYLQTQSTMNSKVDAWKASYPAGSTFSTAGAPVYSGKIVYSGFEPMDPSPENEELLRTQAYARKLASEYFGTTTFMAIGGGSGFTPEIGDQVKIWDPDNHRSRWILITRTAGGVQATETDQFTNKVKWNVNYTVGNGTMDCTSENGKHYIVSDCYRPIKQGDVNGDGKVTTYDVQWLEGYVSGSNSISGKDYNLLMAAIDFNGDWQITKSDRDRLFNTLCYADGSLRSTYNGSTMYGNYKYVVLGW